MKKPQVPNKVTSPVRRLCNRIAPGVQPQYVKVVVESGAEVNDCFSSIENKIKRDGGEIRYGWAIWYLPGVLMEAEFHAIWVSSEGEPIDISPRFIYFEEIMFVPDPKKVYSGRQVDNIRIPLKKDPRIKELINLYEQRFKILNEGELAYKHGPIEVPSEKIRPLIRRMTELSLDLSME